VTEFEDKVRLHEVVRGVVASQKDALAAKKLRVETRVPEDLPALTVNKGKFQRLFELLLKDEIVSLPAGSQITLTASSKNNDLPPDNPGIEIEVRDNGPGLPKEALRTVFDPFALRTDSPLEYGINLMAVYFIVHHHGGRIEAQSVEGQGTTFRILLPVNCDQPTQFEESQPFFEKVLLNERLWEKLMTAD
jgi:signal transduction histidine kinase